MTVSTKQRDPFIDVVKGIGIFSIVIGHASWDIPVMGRSLSIGPFVYLYHLAIFFFCSGYLYKENVTDFFGYVGKKLKGLYQPFLIYVLLYLLFRNLFLAMGILQGEPLKLGEVMINIVNGMAFYSIGEFLSAFWFVPVLFFALSIYTAIIMGTAKISKDNLKEGVRILCYLAVGMLGLLATEKGYGLLYSMHIAFLMIPVIALGHYVALYREQWKLDKCINIFGLLISFFGLVYVLRLNIGIIELSKFMIINRYLFYPVTVCGIWFCLCLGKLFCKSKLLTAGFSLAGRMSFDIMALHFLALKLVDYAACLILGQMENVGAFPHTFIRLWPVYYVVGMVFPIVLKLSVVKVWDAVKMRFFARKETTC